mmetsp:Transcript_3760/g.5820  ORF Transcript_3760/g.5820 Transcript_3760/m.5820 type:complete len:296 (-) Transcript_3760:248-1135(-)
MISKGNELLSPPPLASCSWLPRTRWFEEEEEEEEGRPLPSCIMRWERSSCSRNDLTSACSFWMSCVLGSALTTTLFDMLFARDAYRNVWQFSSQAESRGPKHAIMTVMLFPPRASLSRRVSDESRYGTSRFMALSPCRASDRSFCGICADILANCACFRLMTLRALITFRSTKSERLMPMLCFSSFPVAPVSRMRSEPARSTRCSLDTTSISGFVFGADVRYTVKMECERDDLVFIAWEATARFETPVMKYFLHIPGLSHSFLYKFSTKKPSRLAHRILSPTLFFFRDSRGASRS